MQNGLASMFPGLNPFQNEWDALGRRLEARLYSPENTRQLKKMLPEGWLLLAQKLLDSLVMSRNRQCRVTITVREVIYLSKGLKFVVPHYP
ncbi:hypothetical protein TNCV_2015281 [Trichonephila clavipes]|nr:hypothetical protein TNCV_2015281 [Trichonephila clavipes]